MSKGTCWECEAEGVHIHNHHVVPRSRGGTKTIPLCEACHAHAHHRGKAMTTSALTAEAIAKGRTQGRRHGRLALGETLAVARTQGRPNGRLDVVAVEAEVRTVRRILDLRAEGKSLRAIVAELVADGAETKTGARWHATTVSRVLTRAGVPEVTP